MNAIELREAITKYLKTIPFINYCIIDIHPSGILLKNINKCDLSIGSNSIRASKVSNTEPEFASLLLEHNIKEQLTFDIAKELQSLYDQLWAFIAGCNESVLDKTLVIQISEYNVEEVIVK